MAERMRQIDYAKRHGLSKQRVHQLKADGRVVVDAEGLVDVEASDRNLATMIDQRKANMVRQIELAGRAAPLPGIAWFRGEEIRAHAGEKQEAPTGQVKGATSAADLSDPRVGADAAPNAAEAGANAAELGANGAEGTPGARQEPANSVERPANPIERSPNSGERNAAADYWTHKAMREASEAAMSELKLQERLGNLIELAEVRRAVRELTSRGANKWLQMPAQLAPVIAAMADPQQIEVLLTERVQKVLDEFAGELDQLAATATAERTEPSQ